MIRHARSSRAQSRDYTERSRGWLKRAEKILDFARTSPSTSLGKTGVRL
jgi:hypothetical protein